MEKGSSSAVEHGAKRTGLRVKGNWVRRGEEDTGLTERERERECDRERGGCWKSGERKREGGLALEREKESESE